MAYSSTYDERYTGGFLSNDADDFDAFSTLNSTWRLAEGDAGYGNLTDAYITADRDIYSLGVLSAGHYSIDVDHHTWDFSEIGLGGVSRFELLNSAGAVVDTSYNTTTNIDFTVHFPGTYYVQIIGASSFFEQQYRVEYTKTGNLPANSPAVFTDAFYYGQLFPGEEISGTVTYFDANGNSDNIVFTGWYLDGVFQGTSPSFLLTAGDVGKELTFDFSLFDDLGFHEISEEYIVGTVLGGLVSNGNAGANEILGSAYNDTLNGKGGSDTIIGFSGDDKLIGSKGSDTVEGGSGNDTVSGASGSDKLDGGIGRDSVLGGGGKDTLLGQGGNDTLKGSGGSDTIKGGGGNDKGLGGAGNDLLVGGSGHDTLSGGGGQDTIKGQKGNDRLSGDGNHDIFCFRKGDGNDTISDFELGLDQIEIGQGASRLGQLSFQQIGSDVLVSFSNVQITVLDVQADNLDHTDHFIF